MKLARKMRPDSFAMYLMKKANDPANSVPNPLFSPLHKVAPVFHYVRHGFIIIFFFVQNH